jgi:hypothetical protein
MAVASTCDDSNLIGDRPRRRRPARRRKFRAEVFGGPSLIRARPLDDDRGAIASRPPCRTSQGNRGRSNSFEFRRGRRASRRMILREWSASVHPQTGQSPVARFLVSCRVSLDAKPRQTDSGRVTVCKRHVKRIHTHSKPHVAINVRRDVYMTDRVAVTPVRTVDLWYLNYKYSLSSGSIFARRSNYDALKDLRSAHSDRETRSR